MPTVQATNLLNISKHGNKNLQGLRARTAVDELPQGKRRRVWQHLQGVLLRGTERSPFPTQNWGGKTASFYDKDFDGKQPREVLCMMGRAKKWLESRGFVIQLSGEYHETKIRKLKFE